MQVNALFSSGQENLHKLEDSWCQICHPNSFICDVELLDIESIVHVEI